MRLAKAANISFFNHRQLYIITWFGLEIKCLMTVTILCIYYAFVRVQAPLHHTFVTTSGNLNKEWKAMRDCAPRKERQLSTNYWQNFVGCKEGVYEIKLDGNFCQTF